MGSLVSALIMAVALSGVAGGIVLMLEDRGAQKEQMKCIAEAEHAKAVRTATEATLKNKALEADAAWRRSELSKQGEELAASARALAVMQDEAENARKAANEADQRARAIEAAARQQRPAPAPVCGPVFTPDDPWLGRLRGPAAGSEPRPAAAPTSGRGR